MKTSLPEKKLILDNGIYCPEAVKLAAFVFSGRAAVKIKPGKGVSQVLIGARSADLTAAEFMNEVLNQQCRIDLAKKNSKIAGIIVTKALLSAAGKKG